MNIFKITLKNIQHIKNLEYEIDLSKNSLHCIVGKNGVGKTTLVKAIENFKNSNALNELSRINIVNQDSELVYSIDGNEYKFKPIIDNGRYILDTRDAINQEDKEKIYTELPIPKGKRFDTYEKLGGKIGEDIKTSFSVEDYGDEPTELITILNKIYGSHDRFNDLKEINVDSNKYYIKPISPENYIREDDFSSGEYMLIQIYKLIKTGCKLIVIDELDISLDSSAQIYLIQELRALVTQYEINLIFTTHSLAIMKILENDELFYMEEIENEIIIQNKSYNYIKSLLFQFEGYDKIILTEDKMLQEYLKYIIPSDSAELSKYEIIYIAGASQVVDLMNRNKEFNFFNTKDVISFLDGDKSEAYDGIENITFLPFESIEKELYRLYTLGELDSKVTDKSALDSKLNEKKPSGNSLSDKSKAKIVIDTISFNHLQCIEFINTIADNQSQTNELTERIVAFLQLRHDVS
jgi:ABC-type cobalamin/Fe3+-siderophores transport system ATPase subunit